MSIKTITITGAAGQIGYQLAFRIASGQLLGQEDKINLITKYGKSILPHEMNPFVLVFGFLGLMTLLSLYMLVVVL